MGSSCIIKGCTSKKSRVSTSFHRLPSRLLQFRTPLVSVFGDGNVRDVSRWSRICTQHLQYLIQASRTIEGNWEVNKDFESGSLVPNGDGRSDSMEGNGDQEFNVEENGDAVSPQFWRDLIVAIAFIRSHGAVGSTMIANSLLDSSCPETNVMDTNETKTAKKTDQRENGELSPTSEMPPLEPLPERMNGGAAEPPENGEAQTPRSVPDDVHLPSASEDEDDKLVINEVVVNERKEVHLSSEEISKSDLPALVNGESNENFRGQSPPRSPISLKRGTEEVELPDAPWVKKPKTEDGPSEETAPSSVPAVSIAPRSVITPVNKSDCGAPKSEVGVRNEDAGLTVDSVPGGREQAVKTLVSEKSVTAASILQLDESLEALKKDLCALEFLLMQKEEEWNSILHLTKKKEEMYLRLLRKRQVMRLGGSISRAKGAAVDGELDEPSDDSDQETVMFLPQGVYSSLGTSHFPMAMVKQVLGDEYFPQPQVIPIAKSQKNSHCSASSGGHQNVSVIDIQTHNRHHSFNQDVAQESPHLAVSPDAQTKMGKHMNSVASVKPILPKPSQHPLARVSEAPSPMSYATSSPNSPIQPTGYGPQGPTVSIQHLIAAHRKENPNVPPMRTGKRGSWRPRFEGNRRGSPRDQDRTSGVSSSFPDGDPQGFRNAQSYANKASQHQMGAMNASSNGSLPMNDPSVSYKDVLLQFAQLTQNEKNPGSPQISIIPVNSVDPKPRKTEPIPDSTSITREIPGSSQAMHLSQNLEGSSALAKLLMESGAGGGAGSLNKTPSMDVSSMDSGNPHSLTLSALLSGSTTSNATAKEKPSSLPAGGIHSQVMQMDQSRGLKKAGSHPEEESPTCQGCHRSRAQFVCAGCGNQWYCSRHCQVTSWEKHSEHCNN